MKLTNSVTRTLATAVAVAAVALPVGWALAPASAQPVAATGGPTSSIAPTASTRAARQADRQQRLADQLGVTTDELHEARLAVLQDLLDEKVADGRITQERADQFMDAARSGTLKELRAGLRAERAARR